MTEVRSVSSTGGEKGVKPERHDLVPRRAIAAIARVFGFGAKKYADHNWRRGYEWGKSIAALQRHVDAFVEGETYDPESGEPHLAHAGFHILVLLTWLEQDGEGVDNPFDDRWRTAMERLGLVDDGVDPEEVAEKILSGDLPPSPGEYAHGEEPHDLTEDDGPRTRWIPDRGAPHFVPEGLQRIQEQINKSLIRSSVF